ncbi:MAG: DUF4845 domain-containing protein [Gallionellaceae bacterium]|nr:DUF4845 domain-containing protein [Gallionellaceae bacterium]
MKAQNFKQRGIGMASLIMIIAAVLFVFILAMKLIPAYLHNIQIQKIFKTVVADPEMQSAAIKDIRASYDKRASMDYITDITSADIEVSKDGANLTLSASYTVKVPVAGNVSLVLEFNPSSAN